MANKQMNFSVGIKTTYDAAGINKLKADLTSLANISTNKSFLAPMTEQIPQAIKAANTLRTAITQAYNPKLGTSTIDRFNKSIAKSGMSLKEVQAGLHQFGVQGDMAFVSATSNLLRMDSVARNTNTTFDKMFTTLKNTITWGLSSALWNNMTGSIQKAYYYVRDLDTALNDIRIVTGKSNEEMADFAKNANEAAKALGTSTRNYTEGALIYYQQGLSDEEVKVRNDITAKTSLVTGQSMDQVSEQLTAVWNGYKVSAEEAELYIDRLAAVAATTASDLEELSTGMSKVASAAANLGVSESQLSAILATTISVTRQAPENVGTAYKTIFARISDIKAGLDTETTFGNYTSKMAEMGVSVLDATGNLRDMGEVIEEIGAKWASMTREQQISLAQTMAGTRQYNNLVALFDNWSNYEETLHTAENAAGTLAEQHNIALDSINNRLNILKATWEDLYQNLISSDDIKTLVSSLTNLVQVLANVVKTVGGLKTILPGVAGLFLQLGSAKIGKELGAYINDFVRIGESAKVAELEVQKFKNALAQSLSNDNYDAQVSERQQAAINDMVSYYQEINQYKSVMTAEDEKAYNELLKQQEALTKIELEYEQIKNNVQNIQNQNFGLIKPNEKESYNYLTQSFDFGSLIENKDVEKMNRISTNLAVIKSELEGLATDSNAAKDAVHVLNEHLEYMYDNMGASRGQLEGLQDKLEEYINNSDTATEAVKKFINFLNQMGSISSKAAEGINSINSETEILNSKKDSLRNFLDVKQVISDVTQLAGVFSSLAMTINGLVSIGKVLSDDSLSSGEKFLRIITSIGFILPTIITTITKVAEVIKATTTTLTAQNAIKVANVALSTSLAQAAETEAAAQAKINKELEKQATLKAAIQKENDWLTNNKDKKSGKKRGQWVKHNTKRTNLQKELKNSQEEYNVAQNQINEAQAGVNAATVNAEKTVATNGTAAASGVGLLGNPYILAGIAALTVAITAAVVAYKIYEHEQDKIIKKAEEQAKSAKELADAKQVEIDKLNEVINSYKTLNSQLDQNKITETDFRNQTLALTKDIEDQTIKLALLRGEYAGLEDLMNRISTEKITEEIQNYNEVIATSSNAMSKEANKVVKGQFWNNLGLAIAESNNPDAYESDQGTWQTEGKDNFIIGHNLFASGEEIDKTKEIFNKYLSDYIAIRSDFIQIQNINDENIGAIYEGAQKASKELAILGIENKQLKEFLEGLDEQYTNRKEATDKIQDLQKTLLINNAPKNINSQEEYNKQVSELASQAIDLKIFDEDKYDEARIWANEALSGISDETLQWSKNEALTDTIINGMGLNKDQGEELARLLVENNFSEAQLRYIAPYAFKFGEEIGKGTVDGFVNEIKNIPQDALEATQKQIDSNKIDSAINIANEQKTFNTKAANEILKGTELATDDFQNMNYGNQMITAISLANEKRQYSKEEADALTEKYTKELDAVKRFNEELGYSESLREEFQKDIEQINLQDFFDTSDISEDGENVFVKGVQYTKKELEDLFFAYKEADGDVYKLNDHQRELFKTLEDGGDISKVHLNTVLEQTTGYNRLKKNIDSLELSIANIKASTKNWTKTINDLKVVQEEYSKYLDDLQSAYKTLSAAEKEWNLNEGFSIDTLQNLLKMSPMYLDALEMEGNQFKVNTQRLNEVAIAEANAAVNAWELQQQSIFLAAAQEGVESQAWLQIVAMDNAAGAAENLTSALWEQARTAIMTSDALDEVQKSTALLALEQTAKAGERYRHIANNIDVTKDDKKGSKSSKKDEKDYKDEFDRYWEFIKAIEKVGDAIDQLNKKEKNLYGQEKISLLKNKNDLLKQQVKTYNDLYEEQKREQSELMGALSGKGVTFNAEGEITNYAKRTSEALAQYNEAVAAYNAGTLSETAFKAAEKAYEDFKKEIDRYDKLYYDEMKDTMDKIDDINREVLANNLSAWEIGIKLKIDWESLQREWIDFLSDIDEDFTRVYADLSADLEKSLKKATTYTEQSGTLDTDLQAIYDVMREIDKLEAGGKSDMFESISQAQEKLKTLNTDLMKDSEALYKLWQDAYKAYLEGIDQLNDKFEEQMGYYERIDKELQHQKNLIGLLYGDEAYQMMETLYRNQEKNQLAEIDSLKRQRDLWEEQWKKADEGSQEQLKYYQLMTEAQDNLNDSVEDYIKLLQDDATNAINNILNNYDNWLSNGQGLDTLKADWDDLSDYIDKYYDSVESVYHIENLALKIREGIDEQDSVANQKKLQDLYDKEITYLKEKENLTEYDIKAAEQRYNIALKEIALQDAQDAKNSMKVTRDTNGNWTYQYVADTEEEDKKRQELSDEIYKLYELANNAYNQNLSDLMSLQEEYLARMKEIELEEIKTGKDMAAERDKLNQWYFDNYERLSEENLDYQRDMADAGTGVLKAAYESKIYDLTDFTDTQKKLIEEATKQNIQDFESLSKSVEENISGLGDLTLQMLSETVPEWTAGAREMADAWNADDGISIKSQVTEATEEIINTILDYQNSLDELELTAGVDFDLIIDTINDTTDATEDLKDMVEELCDTNDLDNYKDAVDDLADAWYGVKDAIKDAIKEIEIYLQKLGQTSNVSVSTNVPTSGGGTPGNSGNDNGNNELPSTPSAPTATGYWWSINSSGDAVIGEVGSDKVYATIGRKSDARRAGEGIKRYGMATFKDTSESAAYLERASREGLLQGISYEDLTRNLSSWFKNIPKLNTGGYTGDWLNGDGRLAILHKKELVLNEADTANFLSAVSMIREIASFGTSIEDNIAFGLASFMDKFSGGISINGKGNTDNSKQNIFNINAPITSTATTDEIQRAIIELPNLASQYAARNAF